MNANNKIKKDKKIFLLIIVIAFIGIISANFHIVVDTPKTFVKREYFGFEDPIASIDECTGVPYFIAMSEHQSLCKALQREGYLESDKVDSETSDKFKEARNATRWSDMNSIVNAVYSYAISNDRNFPPCVNEADPMTNVENCDSLAPAYIGEIPKDPQPGEHYQIGYASSKKEKIKLISTAEEAKKEGIEVIQ